MNPADGFDITVELGGFYLDDENAMRPGGLIVLGSLAHHSVRVPDEKQVQSVLLVLRLVDRQSLQKYLFILVLPDYHLRQLR